MSISYRIGAVSKLTKISTDTLRAWERRYGAVRPKRGKEQRGYDMADVDRLILLRRAVEKGHAISTVARLSDAELRILVEPHDPAPQNSGLLIQPLLTALEAFDYAALNEILNRMAAVLPLLDVVHQVILPLMREVGERWHRGELSIAQEHMMTAMSHHLLGTLMNLNKPAASASKVIYSTPEGQFHSLGILTAAVLAGAAGLSPIYLGPSLPPGEIINAARRSGSKAVVLQVTDSGNSVEGQIAEIFQGLPTGAELWVGGYVQLLPRGVLVLNNFADLTQQYQRLAVAA